MSKSTEEGGKAISILCVGVNDYIGEGLCYPFEEAMCWEACQVEWEHLSFCGDAVKVFFFVFIDVCKACIGVFYDILNSKDIVDGKVGS